MPLFRAAPLWPRPATWPGCYTRTYDAATNSNSKALLLDYDPIGTAACDNMASATLNGHPYPLYLQ